MEENKQEIFFAFNMDCERIKTESWMNDGCPSWEISEKAIRGMAQVFEDKGIIAEFCPTSDVAKKHSELFLEMKKRGHGLGLQFHADSFKDLSYRKHLGFYNYKEQKDMLAIAKKDWEDALGMECTLFRTGYNTANDYTFPVLEELGFKSVSSGSPGDYDEKIGRRWIGLYPFPHHCSSKSRLICGELQLYNLLTPSIDHEKYKWKQKNNRRRLRLVVDELFPEETYREIVESSIDTQFLVNQPVKIVQVATHNTFDYLDENIPQRKTMEFLIDCTRDVCKQKGLNFVPATLDQIHQEADRVGAF